MEIWRYHVFYLGPWWFWHGWNSQHWQSIDRCPSCDVLLSWYSWYMVWTNWWSTWCSYFSVFLDWYFYQIRSWDLENIWLHSSDPCLYFWVGIKFWWSCWLGKMKIWWVGLWNFRWTDRWYSRSKFTVLWGCTRTWNGRFIPPLKLTIFWSCVSFLVYGGLILFGEDWFAIERLFSIFFLQGLVCFSLWLLRTSRRDRYLPLKLWLVWALTIYFTEMIINQLWDDMDWYVKIYYQYENIWLYSLDLYFWFRLDSERLMIYVVLC